MFLFPTNLHRENPLMWQSQELETRHTARLPADIVFVLLSFIKRKLWSRFGLHVASNEFQ